MTIKLSRIWCHDKGDRTDAWDAVSKHVLGLIIQARIDELTVLLLDPEMDIGLERIIRNRISELKKSLNPKEV